jgi:hypothetical protein
MSDRLIFDPVGRCIYCGTTHGVLTDEHIIPLGLGGKHILPKASCSETCNPITGRFEGVVQRTIYGDFRMRQKLPTRHKKDRPKLRTIQTADGAKQVPTDEFPAPMWVYHFGICGLLLNAPPTLDVSNGTVSTMTEHRLESYIAEHKWDARLKMTYQPNEFRRMILKAGYGFAVAVLGYDGFHRTSIPYIMKPGANLSYLVGQNTKIEPPVIDGWHVPQIYFRKSSVPTLMHVVAEIRLFGSLPTPTYHAVVGQIQRGEQSRAAAEKLRNTSDEYISITLGQIDP